MSHKITVIVPVYNAEQYLEGCLRSLVEQTIHKSELEVLLVNDGSSDGSEAICRKFTAKCPWMRLINQENGGPSAARNHGIREATGRYLMYLDSDDQLSIDSVRAVRDFFAAHEDEVDLVTYPIVRHQNGRRMPRHYRYRYVSQTGVYDCNEKPFFAQGTINVCVRNLGADNILFEDGRFHHEDETYVTANMERRWKFGYTTEAEYWYNKDNDSSIMATSFHAYYIFEENTAWFEQLFAAYPDHVPLYLQGLLVNDIEWKLRGDLLFPWHYEGEDFDRAAERLRALMRRVDACMITKHPMMSQRQMIFWLNFAGNHDITVQADNDEGVRIAAAGEYNLIDPVQPDGSDPDETYESLNECVVAQSRRMAAMLRRKRMKNGRFSCYGYLDTIYFTASPGTPKPLLFAEENRVLRQIPLFDSCEGCISPRMRIGRMFGFHYEQKPDQLKTLRFLIYLNGQVQPLRLKYGGQHFPALHFKQYRHFSFAFNILHKIKLRLQRNATSSLMVSPKKPKPIKKPIWLYYDPAPGRNSNAFLQFQHDAAKNDGVRRYFLLRRPEDAALFPPELQQNLIRRNGKTHIWAYLRCEWIFTSELALAAISPFAHGRMERLAESLFLRYRIVYLQNGVHQFASQNWYYAERDLAEKVVVSAPDEYDLFRDTYGFQPENLIPAGLARYDTMDRSAPAESRILFAPGWRNYLMYRNLPIPARVQTSDYYKNFCAFLRSPALAALLEEHDLQLDIHLHPKFAPLADLFTPEHPRIHMLDEPPMFTRYAACITDISSVAYDFAYLGRYVQYFWPDAPQLRAGMHEYRVFDLPQCFGPFADTPEDALEQLRTAALRGFAPEADHQARMDGFFYPLSNGREKVYQAMA